MERSKDGRKGALPRSKVDIPEEVLRFPVLVDIINKLLRLLAVIELDDDPGLTTLLVPLELHNGEALLGVIV